MPSATSWSSADVTSSQMMNFGSAASARAMPMRCFCPPESSDGQAVDEAVGLELDQAEELADARGPAAAPESPR